MVFVTGGDPVKPRERHGHFYCGVFLAARVGRPSTRNITAQKSAPHCGQVKRIGKRCKFLTGSGGGKDKVAEMRACADKQ
jgi:hypothetical protein